MRTKTSEISLVANGYTLEIREADERAEEQYVYTTEVHHTLSSVLDRLKVFYEDDL